jgi:hypothetical protein
VSGAPLSSGLTSYRVRGKISGGNSGGGNSGGGKSSRSDGQGGGAAFVTVVNTEAAEEGRLAAELAKAKARMAKHQKLQVGPERVLPQVPSRSFETAHAYVSSNTPTERVM